MLVLLFAVIHSCDFLRTGEEDDSTGQPVASEVAGCWVLSVTCPPIEQGKDLLRLCPKRVPKRTDTCRFIYRHTSRMVLSGLIGAR